MSQDKIECEYVATAREETKDEPASIRECDGEVVHDKVVYCTAEADVVLRPPGMGGLGTARSNKNVFCRCHAKYLRTDAPKDWEQCSENPEALRVE